MKRQLMFNQAHLLGDLLVCFVALLTYQSVVTAHETTTHHGPTKPPPDQYNCSTHTDSCDSCVKNAHCYYCIKTKKCGVYPWVSLRPVPDECGDSLSDIYWKTCAVKLEVLVIVFGILGGLLGFILLVLLTWCCCIRPCVRSCRERQEAKWELNRVKLSEMQSQRRKERNQQRDQIRAKYGLGGPQYDKF